MESTRRHFLKTIGAAAISTQIPVSAVLSAAPEAAAVAAPAINPALFDASISETIFNYGRSQYGFAGGRAILKYMDNPHYLRDVAKEDQMRENFRLFLRDTFTAIKPFYESSRELTGKDPARIGEIQSVMERVLALKSEFYRTELEKLKIWECERDGRTYNPTFYSDDPPIMIVDKNNFESAIRWRVEGKPVPPEMESEREQNFARVKGEIEAMAKAARLDMQIIEALTEKHAGFCNFEQNCKYVPALNRTETSGRTFNALHEFLDEKILFTRIADIVAREASQVAFGLCLSPGDSQKLHFAAIQMESVLQQEYAREFAVAFPGIPIGSASAPLPHIDSAIKQMLCEKAQLPSLDAPQTNVRPQDKEPALRASVLKKGLRAILERTTAKTLLPKAPQLPTLTLPLPDVVPTSACKAPPLSLTHAPVVAPLGEPLATHSHRDKIEIQRNAQETGLDNSRLP